MNNSISLSCSKIPSRPHPSCMHGSLLQVHLNERRKSLPLYFFRSFYPPSSKGQWLNIVLIQKVTRFPSHSCAAIPEFCGSENNSADLVCHRTCCINLPWNWWNYSLPIWPGIGFIIQSVVGIRLPVRVAVYLNAGAACAAAPSVCGISWTAAEARKWALTLQLSCGFMHLAVSQYRVF